MIRVYIPTDKEQCEALCIKHNVSFFEPDMQESMGLVVEENGVILAFCRIKSINLIEPLVSDNKVSTVKLLNEIMSFEKDFIGFVNNVNIKYTNLLSKLKNTKIIKNFNIVSHTTGVN